MGEMEGGGGGGVDNKTYKQLFKYTELDEGME